ncbi:MAG: alpha/beta hydrolase [Gammaproteobacteria bacterium]|nr:alpha/beta hydrolase [Gammaproteobacteria bacterium]
MVLIHGWGDTGATFHHLAQDLAPQTYVIAPDLRGFGDSERAPHGYWFPDYLADVDAVVVNYANARPVVLVGHSMGGNVAGLYAGALADRISHLVLLEGFGLPPTTPDQAPGRYARWLNEAQSPLEIRDFLSRAALIAHLKRLAPRATNDVLEWVATQWATPRADGSWRLKMDPAHKRSNPVLYRREEAIACWRATKASVLLVAAADSDFRKRFPRFDVLAEVAASFRHAREAIVEGAGHMLHWEQPRELAKLLLDFVRTAP